MWTSTFFIKEASSPTFAAWHQDSTYFGLDPYEQVTAWVALTDASQDAGCIEVLSAHGKPRQMRHVPKKLANSINRTGQTITEPLDDSGVSAMPLKAGQFSLHHTLCVHRSAPNHTPHRRIGLGINYIPAHVRTTGSKRMPAMLVRGTDRYGHFDLYEPPVKELGEKELATHDHVYNCYAENYREQMKTARRRVRVVFLGGERDRDSIRRRTALLGALAAPLVARARGPPTIRRGRSSWSCPMRRAAAPMRWRASSPSWRRQHGPVDRGREQGRRRLDRRHRPGRQVGARRLHAAARPVRPDLDQPGGLQDLPYDPVKELTPVTMTNSYPYVLVINSKTPAKDLQEFVALAKEKAGALNYGTTGVGASNHLMSELFCAQGRREDDPHPLSRHGARGRPICVADNVTMVFGDPVSVLPHIHAGTLRALAVTSPQRSPVAPTVPTMAESGYPGVEAVAWHGIFVPAHTPQEIVDKLNAEIVKALQEPGDHRRCSASRRCRRSAARRRSSSPS